MTFYEIENKIKDIVIEKIRIEPNKYSLDSNFISDMDFDSLDLVEMVMYCEEAFNIKIPDELAERMNTPRQGIEEYIKYAPREVLKRVKTRILCLRMNVDGKIEAVMKIEDGSWCFADGTMSLPSSICLLAFTKWTYILKELEDIINDPNTRKLTSKSFLKFILNLSLGMIMM